MNLNFDAPPNLQPGDKVVVGLSGGVDSSVAAAMLKKAGYDVLGLFMKNWDETDENGHCSADEDFKDVEKVCNELDIPVYSIEFVEEYRDHVFSEFLKQYQAGLTPNPDVLCNREIKFDLFLRKAREFGAKALATGHYARLRWDAGSQANAVQSAIAIKDAYSINATTGATPTTKPPQLLRGLDANKDQTYFLTAVPGSSFSNVIFPIGHLQKPQVRELAAKWNLPTFAKKDSTGICFIGERKFRQFLSNYIQSKPGKILDLEGNVVGEHQGSAYYTLGQRKGLGLGGEGEAWFVVAKNTPKNEIIVARGDDHPAMYAHSLSGDNINWFAGSAPVVLGESFECTAKTRYRQIDRPCRVKITGADTVEVFFHEAQRAMTPGQYVVFYQDEVCLGGGIIRSVGASLLELSHGENSENKNT